MSRKAGRFARSLTLEQLEDRVVPDSALGQTTSPNALFVAGLYRDFLNRTPSTAESSSWMRDLQAGEGRTAVALSIIYSPEAEGDAVNALYQTILGRAAAPSESASWVSFLQGGGTIEQVTADILGSNEFYTKVGSDPTAWVKAVYQLELNRLPDAGGLAGFVGELRGGASRTAVAATIVGSPEARGDQVEGLYEQLLHRPASAAEATTWSADMLHGQSEMNVEAAIAGSGEYAQLQDQLGAGGGLTTPGKSSPSLVNLESTAAQPLPFEPNVGQTDPSVGFVAHGQHYDLFLTPTEMVATVPAAGSSSSSVDPLTISLVGSNSSAVGTGKDLLASTSNYFIGQDPSKWLTNVANYGQVEYYGVYAGIDAVYTSGATGQLEFNYLVHPGADPSEINLSIQGGSATLAADGTLHITLPGSATPLVIGAPKIYQVINGVQQPVSGGWTIHADGTIGFQIGAYDRSQTLVIDPVVLFSTYLGKDNTNMGSAIAVDSVGNSYVVGSTNSLDFPIPAGTTPFQGTLNEGDGDTTNSDAFIAKFNSTGTALIYATYLGGTGSEFANAVAVDAAGNVYVTGQTSSTSGTASQNFPTTPGAFQPTPLATGFIPFVAKLNPMGSGLLFGTYLDGATADGSGADAGTAIAVDSNTGNVYVAGDTTATDFPTSPGAALATAGTNTSNTFIAELNSVGGRVYATYASGSNGTNQANGLALDASDDVYITGSTTNSTDFPAVGTGFQTTFGGLSDAYVLKLNDTGSTFLAGTYLGGSDADSGQAIAVDAAGNVYVTGSTNSTNFPTTPGSYQSTAPSNVSSTVSEAFVSKLSTDLKSLDYSTYMGGSNGTFGSQGEGIAVDAAGHAFIDGKTDDTNLQLVNATQTTPSDGFVAALNPAGSSLMFQTYLGTPNPATPVDTVQGLARDANNNLYVVGTTSSATFPTTSGAFQTALGGTQDAFVVEISAPVSPFGAPISTHVFYPLRYIYDAATGLLNGNLTIVGSSDFANFTTVTVVISGLPVGVTVANGIPLGGGMFELTSSQVPLAGEVLRIPIELRDPDHVPLSTFFLGYPVSVFAT